MTGAALHVHVVQVGRVFVSEKFFEATRRTEALRAAFRNRGETFPVYSFVIEHPDGHIVVDTGWHHGFASLPAIRLIARITKVPTFVTADEEIGPRMRAVGLRPEDVRLVIPTHLDADHAGGIGHFPNSRILVNRAEYDYATKTRYGRVRTQPRFWPSWFKPFLYEFQDEPYGSFSQHHSVTDQGDVRIVPTPGHTPSHVSPVFEDQGKKILFGGDHLMRQDWITPQGIRLSAMLHVYKRRARDTNERLLAFVKQFPTLVLPSHDPEAAHTIQLGEVLAH